ncbi:protein FAM26F-like [Stylophora pistillata]|uniref:protein FAM26F-like n=1 Tax=Stylophora pistillata TaxID=50429 RepID=UPI000C054FE2|nr:protein FAM26F-like [Stylophora pistillata]
MAERLESVQVNPSLSQLMTGGISSLKEILKKVELPLQNAFLSGLVLGLKEFLNKLVFKCPERYHRLYSMLFIFVPVVAFFCFALIISTSFWKMVAGCCRLPTHLRRVIWQRSRRFVYLSTLPPIVWLLFALFDTKYYVCAKLGSLEARLNKTTSDEYPEILTEFEAANTESQVIGFILLSVTILFATILISLDRCFSRSNTGIKNEQEYEHYLAEEEIRLFNQKVKPLAKEQAKVQVEALFEKYKETGDNEEIIRQISKHIAVDFPWASTYQA